MQAIRIVSNCSCWKFWSVCCSSTEKYNARIQAHVYSLLVLPVSSIYWFLPLLGFSRQCLLQAIHISLNYNCLQLLSACFSSTEIDNARIQAHVYSLLVLPISSLYWFLPLLGFSWQCFLQAIHITLIIIDHSSWALASQVRNIQRPHSSACVFTPRAADQFALLVFAFIRFLMTVSSAGHSHRIEL